MEKFQYMATIPEFFRQLYIWDFKNTAAFENFFYLVFIICCGVTLVHIIRSLVLATNSIGGFVDYIKLFGATLGVELFIDFFIILICMNLGIIAGIIIYCIYIIAELCISGNFEYQYASKFGLVKSIIKHHNDKIRSKRRINSYKDSYNNYLNLNYGNN